MLQSLALSGAFLAILSISVVPAHATDGPDWKLVTAEPGWQARDSCGEFVFDNQMWILGGWFNSFEAPPRDVWATGDGQSWSRITEAAPWIHSDLPMTQVFDDRMWVMGGWYNGRLPGHSASNAVWTSSDGARWQQMPRPAGWSARLAAGTVVHRDRMWILGGTENYYFGDRDSLKNDVWATKDGTDWDLVISAAGWSPRAYHQAVVLNDRIYVLGGGNYVPESQQSNDVWSSADGEHWQQETAAAAWSPRLWFSAVTWRGCLWVLGGWSDQPSKNWGDVWYSRDGRRWQELRTPHCWKARHEHSAFVFQDRLWIAGGHARPLNSEVWMLDVADDWVPD